MEEETLEQKYSAREDSGRNRLFLKESHPWLSCLSDAENEDVDEVILYTLDEIRFA